jgi:hypothetical protein
MGYEIGEAESGIPYRTPRLLRFSVLFQIIIILALFTAFEIGLRAFDIEPLPPKPNDASWHFRHDPELGWSARANTVSQITITRTVSMRYNSLGMRDHEPVPGASSRILFLGDSFTWGFDVEPEERFSDRLRSYLPGVDILNAGITGYGTDQQYLQLQRLWPDVNPSVVVLIFCVDNDRQDNSANYRNFAFKPYLAQVDGQWQFLGQPVPVSSRQLIADNWFARHFATIRLAIVAYSSIKKRETSVPDPTEHLIAMMRDFVELRGAKFLVGLQRNEPVLEEFLNSQRIPYTRFDEAERFPSWGSHWTPGGHTLVAERLLTLLSKEGAIPIVAKDQ